jgi:hypothetical protein
VRIFHQSSRRGCSFETGSKKVNLTANGFIYRLTFCFCFILSVSIEIIWMCELGRMPARQGVIVCNTTEVNLSYTCSLKDE